MSAPLYSDNKVVISCRAIFSMRGGYYGDEHPQLGYVRQFLGFIGIHDVKSVIAKGLAAGDEPKEAGLSAAHLQLAQL